MMFHRQIVFRQKDHAFYHVPSLVVATDGSVLAFCEERWRSPCDDTGECHIVMKKSGDGGETWGPLVHLRKREGAKFHMGSAAVDAAGNRVLLMCDGGWLESRDNGENWQDWTPQVYHPQGAHPGSTHGSGPGIVLQYGVHRGRMVWPGRTIVSDTGYDDLSIPDRQAKCYSMVFFSDDRGATIHSSHFFLQGTGEGCLSERCNGDLYFNVRAYWGDGCRYTAVSRDGGEHFVETPPDANLREMPQGCSAGMVCYPPELCGGRDILLFANPDTVGNRREHGVVRASFDGGLHWPVKKEVAGWGDWFDYSSMAVAKDGTILLMYKTTPSMSGLAVSVDECCSMALVRFNLRWLGLPV